MLTLANFVSSTLAQTLLVGGTDLTVQTGDGALFPDPAAGNYMLVLENTAGVKEIVRATGRSGDLISITRAQEGTSAVQFAIGSRVEIRLTTGFFTEQELDGGTF